MSLSRLDEFESFPLSDETMVKHSVVSDSIAKLGLFPHYLAPLFYISSLLFSVSSS